MSLCLLLFALACVGMFVRFAVGASGSQMYVPRDVPPLPVLPPTSLTGDAGDGCARLAWNKQIEDQRIVGWHVHQCAPLSKQLTEQVLTTPEYVVRGLANGESYTFAVVGVLSDGSTTPLSNTATVTPRNVGAANVSGAGDAIEVAGRSVELGDQAVRIDFPDGQSLVYDQGRPVDWRTRSGEHMLSPSRLGNGFDVGRFDRRGYPGVVPPEEREAAELEYSTIPQERVGADGLYHHPQFGTKHAYLVDPITMPTGQTQEDGCRWLSPAVEGDRVTLHFTQPIDMLDLGKGEVEVWETWWPIERNLHGTTYHGLARRIEVKMPAEWKRGYSVMVNNGFGPAGGDHNGVMSYDTGFRNPSTEIVDFTGDQSNVLVGFKHRAMPRHGKSYHPDQDCLQSHPVIFYEFPNGSMTITSRSLYYHTSHMSSTYVEQGATGVWPNFAWDIGLAGERVAVDTLEYLYVGEPEQPLPQRFLNARFSTFSTVSRRMGVQGKLIAVNKTQPTGHVERHGGPLGFADHYIEKHEAGGADAVGAFHDFWHAVPATVEPEYMEDPSYGVNPQMKQMTERLKSAGIEPGFWYRPDFVKASMENILADTMPDAAEYYGFSNAIYPDVVKRLNERGMPMIRNNTHWVRKHIDGNWPGKAPYGWVPMSLATEWWDKVMWPTLHMSSRLGFTWMLHDGGQGGLQGVEYAPLLNGQSEYPLATQPFWWRVVRSAEHVGIRYLGECTMPFLGGYTNFGGDGDEHFLWMFHGSLTYYDFPAPEQMHRFHQLYNSHAGERDQQAFVDVRRFAERFYKQHDAPGWIELKDLRQLEPRTITLEPGQAPVTGESDRTVSKEGTITLTVRPWTWGDVVWHFADGSTATYPGYDEIDWASQRSDSQQGASVPAGLA